MRKGFLIDMDGVIYSGNDPISSAKQFIDGLQKKKIPFLMTNNSQRSPLDIVNKLKPFYIACRLCPYTYITYSSFTKAL